MIFFTNILAVLAVILPYARNVVAASDDEMAVLCFDELGAFPYIDVCFFKPGASDAGQCSTNIVEVSFAMVVLTLIKNPWITSSTALTAPGPLI